MVKDRAVFFDRDGTLIREVGYLWHLREGTWLAAQDWIGCVIVEKIALTI